MEHHRGDFYKLDEALSLLPPKPRKKWLIRMGKTVRFVFIANIAAILAYSAPSIGDRPLGTITLNELVGGLFCFGLALACIKWMFNSIEDETAENWATGAVSVAAIAIIIAMILYRMS